MALRAGNGLSKATAANKKASRSLRTADPYILLQTRDLLYANRLPQICVLCSKETGKQ
jgi:hypothetical protein